MKTCGILEVHSGDELGKICGRRAITNCADCGARVCALHAATCGKCGLRFCGSCLGVYLANHYKSARKDVARKSA